MAEYPLYIQNINGHIMHAIDLVAGDDWTAIRIVQARQEATDLELWCGRRKVASMPEGGPIILSAPASPASSADPRTS